MRCLSYAESSVWLSHSDIAISASRDLLIPESPSGQRKTISAQFPQGGFHLNHLSAAIANWIPANEDRMLWLKNWETTPSFEIQFFEAIRGANTHLIEAPGHVFSPDETKAAREDDCYGPETAIIAGFLLLIMCYDWEAYLVANGRTDYVYVSNNHIWLSSAEEATITKGLHIFRSFDLMVKAGR